jgi:hypothetical protein
MSEPLDEQYLIWLYARIGSVKVTNPSRTYWSLIRQLFTKEFVWIIPNDDNRVEDGRDLRYRFLEENNVEDIDPNWMGLGCSILELLLGLANRLSFEAEGFSKDWFWELLKNLGLDKYNDAQKNAPKKIDEVMDKVIWRTYDFDGRGGLFPLKEPREDQRDVEIWYQLCAYLLERD